MPPRKRSVTPRKVSRSRTPSRKPSATPSTDNVPPKFVEPVFTNAERKFTPEKDTWDGHYEFGGPAGAIGMIIFSHFIVYYFWMCIEFFQGSIVYPGHELLQGKDFWATSYDLITTNAAPSLPTFGILTLFYAISYILAIVLPGPVTYGLPVPSENGYKFPYKCNAVYSWYVILVTLGVLHYTDVWPLWTLRENFGRYMTAAVIWADLVALVVYVQGLGRQFRMSGNIVYDYFMGSCLNPRLPGGVDLKLWAEIRNSWVLLFILTISSAAEMYKQTGNITGNMWFMITAHFLYVNACQKGEECIPTTWDIYYEKFGWMLIYWNFTGVPFVYCFQSLYIQTVIPTFQYPNYVLVPMFVALFLCYYVWDTMNSQKNRFRMKRQGVEESIIRRKTFPQLPWGYIENPKTIRSERGELFVDGWYQFGRKIHYTVDMCMSLLWGLSCGINAFIPYFYFCFFFSHLVHRQARDDERCRKKYGKLWDKYVELVPYKFIPGIY